MAATNKKTRADDKRGNKPGNPLGAGRKPGIKNKWTMLTDEQRKNLAEQNDGVTPLQFFLSMLRDPGTPIQYKILAAKEAAPYMHRKMPIGVEGGDPSKPLQIINHSALRNLTPEELVLLVKLGLKID